MGHPTSPLMNSSQDSDYGDANEPFFPEQEFLARCPTGTYVRALRRLDRNKKLFPSEMNNKPFEVQWDNQFRMSLAKPGVTMMTATLQNLDKNDNDILVQRQQQPAVILEESFIKKLIKGEWMTERDSSKHSKPWKSFVAINKRLACSPSPNRTMTRQKIPPSAASFMSYEPSASGSTPPVKRPLMAKDQQQQQQQQQQRNSNNNSQEGHRQQIMRRAQTPMTKLSSMSPNGSHQSESMMLQQMNSINANLKAFREIFRSFDVEHTGYIGLQDFQLLSQVVEFGLNDLELIEFAQSSMEMRGGRMLVRYTNFLKDLHRYLVSNAKMGKFISFSKSNNNSRPSTSGSLYNNSSSNNNNNNGDAFGVLNSIFEDWQTIRKFMGQNGRMLLAALETVDQKHTGRIRRNELMKALVSMEGSARLPLVLLSQLADMYTSSSSSAITANALSADGMVDYAPFLNACVSDDPPPGLLQQLQQQQQQQQQQLYPHSEEGGGEVRGAIAAIDRISQQIASSRPSTSASRPATVQRSVATPMNASLNSSVRFNPDHQLIQGNSRPSTSMGFQRTSSPAPVLPPRGKTPVELRTMLKSSQIRKPLIDRPTSAEQIEWKEAYQQSASLASNYAVRDRVGVIGQLPDRLFTPENDKLSKVIAALKQTDSRAIGKVRRETVISALNAAGYQLSLFDIKGLLHDAEIWADGLVDIAAFEDLFRDFLTNRQQMLKSK